MESKKINKINVSVFKPDTEEDQRPVRGNQLFSLLNANIYICAKKLSGKSTLIYNIIKRCTDDHTQIFICCTTINNDPIYKHIEKTYPNSKLTIDINDLLKFTSELSEEKKNEDLPAQPEKLCIKLKECNLNDEKKPKIIRKYKSPDYLFVLDDMGKQCQKFSEFLKIQRHFSSKCILSSQYINDLALMQLQNLDYCILFGGHPQEKLEHIYRNIDLSLPFDLFLKIYKDATTSKFNFLYIDIRNERFRKNFNTEYII